MIDHIERNEASSLLFIASIQRVSFWKISADASQHLSMVNMGYTEESNLEISVVRVNIIKAVTDVTVARIYVGRVNGSVLCHHVEWTSSDILHCSPIFNYSPLPAKVELVVPSPLRTYIMFVGSKYISALYGDQPNFQWHTQMLHSQSISGVRFIRDFKCGSCEKDFLSASYDGDIIHWSVVSSSSSLEFQKKHVVIHVDAPLYGLDVDTFGIQISFLDTVIGSHVNSNDVQANPYLRSNHGRVNIIPSPALTEDDGSLLIDTLIAVLREYTKGVSLGSYIDLVPFLRLLIFAESTVLIQNRQQPDPKGDPKGSTGPGATADKQQETQSSMSMYSIWQRVKSRLKSPVNETVPMILNRIELELNNCTADSQRFWKCLHVLYCGSYGYYGIPMAAAVQERVMELRGKMLHIFAEKVLRR